MNGFGIPAFQQPQVPSYNAGIVPAVHAQRSVFDKSRRHLTTMDAGYLYPLLVDQIYPGTTVDIKPTILARINTLLKPLMHRGAFEWEGWFVPDRLTQENFKYMMGEQNNPGDSIDYVRSKIDFGGSAIAQSTLFDYFGLPTQVVMGTNQIIASHALAYNMIWNNDYRDQNYQDSVYFSNSDGPHGITNFVLKKRAKYHDRFTSALPWQQKGDPVSLPLGLLAPVVGIGAVQASTGGMAASVVVTDANNTTQTYPNAGYTTSSASGVPYYAVKMANASTNAGGNYPLIFADLSSATAATIPEFIYAYQAQQLLMIDAQRGTRFPEFMFAHFGVVSDDARMQRPEYLGGGTVDFVVGPVPNTSSASGNLGDLGAYGVAFGSGHGESIHRSFTEYGSLMILVSFHADLLYQQGIEPMWIRDTKDSMYLPILASIPEQPILNQEIVYTNTPGTGSTDDQGTWGFNPAWEDMRVGKSMVTGAFRSNYSGGSLDVWHLAQDFRSGSSPALPAMGDSFIQENPPMGRVVATPDQDTFQVDVWFDYKCTQVMPLFGMPGLSTHL